MVCTFVIASLSDNDVFVVILYCYYCLFFSLYSITLQDKLWLRAKREVAQNAADSGATPNYGHSLANGQLVLNFVPIVRRKPIYTPNTQYRSVQSFSLPTGHSATPEHAGLVIWGKAKKPNEYIL